LTIRLASALSRRVTAIHARAIKQTDRPHVELHRIVFAGRKTAWAALVPERSADARVGWQVINAEAGLSGAVAGPDSASRAGKR
jgi:hypothetical protein